MAMAARASNLQRLGARKKNAAMARTPIKERKRSRSGESGVETSEVGLLKCTGFGRCLGAKKA